MNAVTARWATVITLLGAGILGGALLLSRAPTQPAAAQRAPAPTFASDVRPTPDPFPVTEAMTDAVRLILDDYLSPAARQRAAPLAAPNTESLVVLPAILSAPVTEPAPSPSPTPAPGDRADIAVTLRPFPSIRVTRGGQLEHVILVDNHGSGSAEGVAVTLPYRTEQLVLVSSQFSDERDWVSEVTGDHVIVRFGPVVPGEERSASLFFRVNAALLDDTVLAARASFAWDDRLGVGDGRSNWAPVLVGGGNDNAQWVWVAGQPASGAAGTSFAFFSDRFIPGEGIHLWLNTPVGVAPLEERAIADPLGRVWLTFDSSSYASGSYEIVLYGARSGLTGVQTFFIW